MRVATVRAASRAALAASRGLSTSAPAATDAAASTAGRAFRVQPYDDVPLLERPPRPPVDASRLFTRAPIGAHTDADARRYFELRSDELERSFPEGVGTGVSREFAATNLPALMVRPSALAARRAIDALAADAAALRSASALVLTGARGAGKSATLSYLVHAARSSGWLVLHLPSAHAYLNGQRRFAPLAASRVEISLVAAPADSADGAAAGLGASATELDALFDVPAATAALLRGFARAHETALAKIDTRTSQTQALSRALNSQLGTLADLVQLGTATDAAGADTELCSHALVALLAELAHVTDAPVMIAVDDANIFDRATAFRDPHTAKPLPARSFLLPALLRSAATAGSSMRRGLVLCAPSASLSYHPHETPRAHKRRVRDERARTQSWAAVDVRARGAEPPAAGLTLVDVPPYDEAELSAALSYYAHCAAWLPPAELSAGLAPAKAGAADGAARQVHLLTASRGEAVRKLCTRLG